MRKRNVRSCEGFRMPADDARCGELGADGRRSKTSKGGNRGKGWVAARALWRFDHHGWGAEWARLGSSAMMDGAGAAEPMASAVLGDAGRRRARLDLGPEPGVRARVTVAGRRPVKRTSRFAAPGLGGGRHDVSILMARVGWPISRWAAVGEGLDDDHAAAAAGTGMRGCRRFITGVAVGGIDLRLRHVEQLAGPRDVVGASGAGEQAVVADAVKAVLWAATPSTCDAFIRIHPPVSRRAENVRQGFLSLRQCALSQVSPRRSFESKTARFRAVSGKSSGLGKGASGLVWSLYGPLSPKLRTSRN